VFRLSHSIRSLQGTSEATEIVTAFAGLFAKAFRPDQAVKLSSDRRKPKIHATEIYALYRESGVIYL
jgi:hypothetical protein